MALDRTSGFDMLVQVSENEINAQLATLFLAGGVIPPSMSVPVNTSGVVGTANLNFGAPTADLDRPRPQMGITIPFLNSELQLTAPLPLTLSPLAGSILVVDALEVITQGSNQITTMDFNNGAPTVTVDFDPATEGLLAPLLAAAGLSTAQAENLMAGVVLQQLQASVGRVDLTPPIPVVDDTDPTTIFDIDVTTVNDTTAVDRDCVSFGIRMGSDSGGNINLVNTNFIPAGSESLVMMSNFWLLARVMRPRVATALGRPVTDFDTPLRLNRSIPAPGGQGTLTSLEARVEGNRIRVDGRATDSGTGWSAVSDFTFFIDIALSGGSITVTATTPTVNTDVDLEWWVWLASLGLGALFGGIVGVIVAAIVLAVIEAVAEGIANNMISSGITGSLGSLPSVPLGPIGGGLTLTAVVLDDLELRCSIVRSVSVPVKHQGTHSSSSGFAIDLDTGAVRSAGDSQSDLVWLPSSGLATRGAAGLTVTGTSYGALTPVNVSKMPHTSHNVALSMIPFSPGAVVFGARTAQGRYAKVRAWRSGGSTLNLEWVTWDTPVPQLDLAARWSIADRGEVTEYLAPDCSMCRTGEVSRRGVFEAWPRLMAFPVDYQWCLCGTVLEEGQGEVASADGPLAYRLAGRTLEVLTDLGQDVDCELCVSAVDARGMELFTCIRLLQSGAETSCRKCEPRTGLYAVEVIPAAIADRGWRRLLEAGQLPEFAHSAAFVADVRG